jgi:signal transduction histidine kinase/CheY-like chemotaxis protein
MPSAASPDSSAFGAGFLPRTGKLLGWHLLLLGALVGSALVAMRLIALPPTNLTAIWLPVGIALVAMLRGMGWWALPTIWIGNCLVVYLVNGYPLTEPRPFTWLLALVNTGCAALSFGIWRRWLKASPFADTTSYLRFVGGVALLPNLLTAWLVIAVIYWAGFLRPMTFEGFLIRSAINTLSGALAILLVVPLGWSGAQERGEKESRQSVGRVVLSALAGLVVGWVCFATHPFLLAVSIPLALFAALYGGPRAVASAVLALTVYGLFVTARGIGVFHELSELAFEPVLAMAVFAFALSLPGQYAGIAQAALKRQQETLEETVRARTSALSETEERLRLAVESVSDGIFDWRLGEGPPRCNPAFFRMLGFPPTERAPKWSALRRFLHHADRHTVDVALESVFSGETNYFEAEARVRTAREGWVWIRGRGRVVHRSADGRAERFVGTTTNITAERERLEALAEARDRAEVAERAKSDFLATMSHEIRTPLNGVMGFAELLEHSPLNDDQREFVGAIHTSGKVLLSLLNDILDLSKIEVGAMRLEEDPCDLRKIVREVCDLFFPNASAKGLELRVTIDGKFPAAIYGDSLRLRQILSNLVSNAVKFTERGKVQVSLGMFRRDGGEPLARIAVEDSGIGIAPEHIDRLFGHFQQADSSTTRRFGGSGLGLSIARRLARLMGGEVRVESVVGKGSTFYLEIPLRAVAGEKNAESAERTVAAAVDWERNARPLHLLIVEDNPLNRRVVQAFLTKQGYSYEVTNDGVDGLAAFCRGKFDAVLLDLQMPRLDGLSMAREIRKWELAQKRVPTPLIALTAAASEKDQLAAKDAGIDAFISKPLRFGVLAEHLSLLQKTESSSRR